ncbi:MAG TPA: hypothetical protein VHY09_00305 [Candidatus Methylacidiphilales bacterium]|jgi:hypothetical protein|nr:hypothetical protein [Candidatus Methylacidiphilales bacterium]
MMRNPVFLAAGLALAAFLMTSPASAQIYYYGINAPLGDGSDFATPAGTVSGWVELNLETFGGGLPGLPNTTETMLNYDLVASPATGFTGFEYTLSDSTIQTNLQGEYVIVANNGSSDEIMLQTSAGSAFSTTGPTQLYASFEVEPVVGNQNNGRAINGDAIPEAAPTPEPSSWVLAGLAAGILTILRFRSRQSVRA